MRVYFKVTTYRKAGEWAAFRNPEDEPEYGDADPVALVTDADLYDSEKRYSDYELDECPECANQIHESIWEPVQFSSEAGFRDALIAAGCIERTDLF